MQLQFEVLHSRPKIRVRLTRDSVAAGDDADALHERWVEVYSFVDPVAFVNQFLTGYLPSVAGFGHSWTVQLNGDPVASIKGGAIEPKTQRVVFDDAENAIHFQYHSATY